MKIAIVAEHYDPLGGGAERSTHQIAEELIGRGHDVTVLAGYGPQVLPPAPPKVIICPTGKPRGAIRLLLFARWVERKLKQEKFDTSLSITTVAPARVVQPRSGIMREAQLRNIARRPTPWKKLTKRVSLALSPKQWMIRRLETATMRSGRVRRFVAISTYVCEQIQTHFQIADDRIALIPNAVVMPPMMHEQRIHWRTRLREELRIEHDAPVYLFISHNPMLKGIHPLLHAYAALLRDVPRAVLLIAGGWSYSLETITQRIGVRQRVRLLGQTNEVAKLYCVADVTVLPSYFDPSSKVVLESLAMGVPAITTCFNGAGDFVIPADGSPPRGRVIADPDDTVALRNAMFDLAQPDELARCQAAAAGLADMLSMRRHADALEIVLTAVAG